MTKTITAMQVQEFKRSWPCSNLPDDTAITFEYATNGDLIDCYGTTDAGINVDVSEFDGDACVALSHDAQNGVFDA